MKWKRIGQVLLSTVAILLMIAALVSWRLHARLEKQIAAVREAGDPVSLSDLNRTGIAPDDNAAIYLQRIVDDGERLYGEINPYVHPDDFSARDGLTDEQIQKVEAGFAAYPTVLPTLEQAATCTTHAWPLDYSGSPEEFFESLMSFVSASRNFARLIDARSRYLVSVGQPDEAAHAYLQSLQLTRLQDQEPSEVVFLVNIACRAISAYGLNEILQTSDLKSETHGAVETELARHEPMEPFLHALRTERAIGIQSFRTMPRLLGMLKRDWSNYMEVMDQQIAMGAKSHFELVEVQPVASRGITQTVEPALAAAREAMNRSRATIRCLRILNQIRARRITADAAQIDSLGLPQEITCDPYNGKPLTVRSTPNGWIVYSVGQDGKDDGGKLVDLSDVGVGPPEVMF